MSIPPHTNPFNGTTKADLLHPGEANEFMVGGSHYHKGDKSFQHWDLVALLSLGYYEGQITRYISRAKKKNGIQDYQKAHHYAVKMRELYHTRYGGLMGWFFGRMYKPQHGEGVEVLRNVNEFCRQQGLDSLERSAMLMACLWRTTWDLDLLVDKTGKLKSRLHPEESLEEQMARTFKKAYEPRPAPEDGGEEPWVGYVCQDPDLQAKEHPKPAPSAEWPYK